MEPSLTDLNGKIDALSAQVAYLTEQARISERQRQDRAELIRDVTPIAHQAFQMTIEQLEEVQEYIDLGDVLRLIKRLLRNGRNLEKMLDQIESLLDLLDTLAPLSDQAFLKAVDTLDELDRKGYFSLAQSGAKLMDHAVSTITADDINRLGDSIVPILNMVKDISRPEVIHFAHNTITAIEQEVKKPVNASMFSLLSQLRDPAVRRGLALTMCALRVIGSQGS